MRGSKILAAVVAAAIVASLIGGGRAALADGASSAAASEEGVREALRAYIQGINEADASKLERALHPEWRMIGLMENGELSTWDRGRFVEIWGTKREGMAPGRDFVGTILTVDITGRAAFARVRLENDRVLYTDYLSLLNTPDGWRIVNKIWDTEHKGS